MFISKLCAKKNNNIFDILVAKKDMDYGYIPKYYYAIAI
jgi:hypothetical protein